MSGGWKHLTARRFDDVQNKLSETEKEARQAKEESTRARDEFNDLKKRRCVTWRCDLKTSDGLARCDLFNKAFSHMSGCIDKVYKDLTKGKAFPMGGVAYLSLEDDDVSYLLEWNGGADWSRNHTSVASNTTRCRPASGLLRLSSCREEKKRWPPLLCCSRFIGKNKYFLQHTC